MPCAYERRFVDIYEGRLESSRSHPAPENALCGIRFRGIDGPGYPRPGLRQIPRWTICAAGAVGTADRPGSPPEAWGDPHHADLPRADQRSICSQIPTMLCGAVLSGCIRYGLPEMTGNPVVSRICAISSLTADLNTRSGRISSYQKITLPSRSRYFRRAST